MQPAPLWDAIGIWQMLVGHYTRQLWSPAQLSTQNQTRRAFQQQEVRRSSPGCRERHLEVYTAVVYRPEARKLVRRQSHRVEFSTAGQQGVDQKSTDPRIRPISPSTCECCGTTIGITRPFQGGQSSGSTSKTLLAPIEDVEGN